MFRQKLILAAVAVVVLTVMCGCDHGVRIDETNPNADVPTNTPISESGESATRETDAPEIEAEETTVINEADFEIVPEDIYFRISITDKHGNHTDTNAYFIDSL